MLDHTERRSRLISSIAAIAEIDRAKIQGTDRLREDLGLDSLGSLELLSTLSEQLRIDIEVEDAMDIRTVEDACAFVEKSWHEQRGAA